MSLGHVTELHSKMQSLEGANEKLKKGTSYNYCTEYFVYNRELWKRANNCSIKKETLWGIGGIVNNG